MAHKKRERTRQQAKEKREFQKFMLIKVGPPTSPFTSIIVFQSLAGPGYFMPAEPEMPSEPELRTPPDTKRHELVVFNPGEVETGGQEKRIHDEEIVFLAAGNGVQHVQPRLLHTVV